MAFLTQDSKTARTSGLAECAKAVTKTKLGRRLLILTCIKPRLFLSQKSTNEGARGHVGPGFTSTSPAEQRRSRMRVRLKAIKTGHLERGGQIIIGADFGCGRIYSGHNAQTGVWWGAGTVEVSPGTG